MQNKTGNHFKSGKQVNVAQIGGNHVYSSFYVKANALNVL